MCKSSSDPSEKKSGETATSTTPRVAAENLQTLDNMVTLDSSSSSERTTQPLTSAATSSSISSPENMLKRRCKRDRQKEWSKQVSFMSETGSSSKRIIKRKKKSSMTAKHQNDSKSGGVEALIPSAIGVVVLVVGIMAKMGFRGRSTVAGIDLGTTNSVICVQAPSKGVGEIVCIPDPATNSPVVPSVVSFLDNHHLKSFRLSKEERETSPPLVPHPIDVVVGEAAKNRINAHPHHTVYHAKRIIGRGYEHDSVNSLKAEVEFEVVPKELDGDNVAAFKVPYHLPPSSVTTESSSSSAVLTPPEIGSYIINHLRTMTRNHLGHNNIQSAVIAIPAKFEQSQRDATVRAFELAGLKVARILEEPTAAALAYGLHKRDDVHYVMVYDFGGGTLDISLLYVGEGGFIDVLGSDGDEQLGGADFDSAVAHWLMEKGGGNTIVHTVTSSVRAIEKGIKTGTTSLSGGEEIDVEDIIEEICLKLKHTPLCTASSMHTLGERIKISLSNHPNEQDAVAAETCFGIRSNDSENIPQTAEDLCSALTPVNFSLSLKDYDSAVDHLYKRSLSPIKRLLKDLNLQKEEIDEVVMVGGTTRMPQIRELVRLELGKERLNTHIDPDLTVAYGAASVID
ncbi:hypothetical protein HJC23_010198 [Cyclotella cryptica]|uniref:Heat shock protein 70 n=1 Tax=Cyclotella cryptica TaxID=29204 RepID=A0ABD3PHK0_9STRA|eukprot:CCRYP_014740-RB/>CCRYP_014740-RB protein AED:0.02 eAED:0.02 QI:134/1/1/1/1/1/2/421/624